MHSPQRMMWSPRVMWGFWLFVFCFLERRAAVIYGGYFGNNGLIKAAFFITSPAGWLMIGLGLLMRIKLE